MKIVRVQSASHWYDAQGNPVHQVPMKSDPNKMRDTNLSDARKLGLRPSSTNVVRTLAKPELEAWKTEQVLMAALTMPVIEGETIEQRAKRAVREGDSIADGARKRGTLAHKCIEVYLTTGRFEPHDDVAAIMAPVPAWFDANVEEVYASEATLVGAGWAGRTDLIAKLKGFNDKFIIDFKTRKPSSGKLRCYDEDGLQLGSYALAIPEDAPRIASVLINSEEPSAPTLHVWEVDDQKRYQEAFLNLFNLWKLLKGYNPETGLSF